MKRNHCCWKQSCCSCEMASARCSSLITVKWLKDFLASKPGNHKIVDASWHLPVANRDAKAEYAAQHIPGAVFFDIEECSNKEIVYPHMIPTVPMFEEYVGGLGINNDTHVVLYDNHGQFPLFSAQRVWWTFRLFGHSKVSMLEGGLPKWIAEGGEVTDKVTVIDKDVYKAHFNPHLVKYYEDVEKNISDCSYTLVDARPEGRFKGVSPEPRKDTKPGSIVGSKNVPFMSVMNVEQRTMKSPEEIKAIFEKAGVNLNQPLAFTCGTGVSACVLAVAAHMCGKEDVAVYDGSWTEWYHRAPANLKLNVPVD